MNIVKNLKKNSLIIALVFVSFVAAPAQTINGKEIKNRDLEWSDFVGNIDKSSRFDAYTDWVTSYSFPRPTFKNGKAQVKVTVRLFLTTKSWVKPDKKTERLLNHERGHFKIGRICAKDIEETINSSTFDTDDYAQQIADVYWEIINEYKELDKQYDSETDHYKNQEQQALWDEKLDELLDQ